MIKTTLGKLAKLRDSGTVPGALTKLASADERTTFANRVIITRFLKPMIAELIEYNSALDKLGLKYGKPGPSQGGQLVVSGDDVRLYQKELDELNKIEVEIQATPLSFKVIETVNLAPGDLLLLEDFIDPSS